MCPDPGTGVPARGEYAPPNHNRTTLKIMLAVPPPIAYHLPMAPHSQRSWYDIIWDHLHVLAFGNLSQQHWQDHPRVWIIASTAVADLVNLQEHP